MANTLESIVFADRDINSALDAGDSFRLQRLAELYRLSNDKDAFVLVLITRLMLEHDRRALACRAATPTAA